MFLGRNINYHIHLIIPHVPLASLISRPSKKHLCRQPMLRDHTQKQIILPTTPHQTKINSIPASPTRGGCCGVFHPVKTIMNVGSKLHTQKHPPLVGDWLEYYLFLFGGQLADREERSDEWDSLCFGLESLIQQASRTVRSPTFKESCFLWTVELCSLADLTARPHQTSGHSSRSLIGIGHNIVLGKGLWEGLRVGGRLQGVEGEG